MFTTLLSDYANIGSIFCFFTVKKTCAIAIFEIERLIETRILIYQAHSNLYIKLTS